eukprot:1455566-Prymnesium_polylepis.2
MPAVGPVTTQLLPKADEQWVERLPVLAWHPHLELFAARLGRLGAARPSQPAADAVHVRVDGDSVRLAPRRLREEVAHLGTHAGQRKHVQERTRRVAAMLVDALLRHLGDAPCLGPRKVGASNREQQERLVELRRRLRVEARRAQCS